MVDARDGWRALSEETVEELPETPGVFTLGNLVRSVLLVSADGGEGVRAAVRAVLSRPEIRARARCLRVEPSEDPGRRQSELLAAYGAAHGGSFPPAQGLAARAGRPLTPLRADGPPRPGPARYPATLEATFLRSRTVA